MIPKTELRTGEGCGIEFGCDSCVAVDIVGGVEMDKDAMDDTKSDMLEGMLSASAKIKERTETNNL